MFRRQIGITASLLVILAAATSAAAQNGDENLVVNGDFAGNLSGWDILDTESGEAF